jgi:hypothetical protein
MLKEAVVAYFKLLLRHFPGGTEQNYNYPVTITGFRIQFEPGISGIRGKGANHSTETVRKLFLLLLQINQTGIRLSGQSLWISLHAFARSATSKISNYTCRSL